MNDVLTMIGDLAKSKLDLADSTAREAALQAQITRINAALKDEQKQRASIEATYGRTSEKLQASGLKPDQIEGIVNAQADILRTVAEAQATSSRQHNRRPKAEKLQLEIARKQGFEAGQAASQDGGLDKVANPWAAGSAEAAEFLAGLHEGFSADETMAASAPVESAKSSAAAVVGANGAPAPAEPAEAASQPVADALDAEIVAGLDAGKAAATDVPDDDPFAISDARLDDWTFETQPGRAPQFEDPSIPF